VSIASITDAESGTLVSAEDSTRSKKDANTVKNLFTLLLLVSTVSIAAQQTRPGQDIDKFFSDFTAQWIRANPNSATAARYFSGEEQDRLERQLTPETLAYRQDRINLARKGLGELRKFDRSGLSETERVSADLMEWQLETVVGEEPYLDYSFPLNQFNGVNVSIIEVMTVRHPLSSQRDAENYLAALSQVGTRVDEAVAEASRLARNNRIPPRFIIEATLKQMRQFIATASEENPFVTTLGERTSSITSIAPSRRMRLVEEAAKIVGSKIYPAWQRAIAVLEPLAARASDDAGLSRFSNGSEAYAYFLRRFTTTKLTAEQIHEIGLREVARIEKEMDGILRQLHRPDGPISERIQKLKADLGYPLTEDGRKLIMSDVEQILRDAERRSQSLFDERPKAPVRAQPFPRFREANAAANYNSPAPDGSRPGTFQIPLRPERMTKFGLRSLVYHETVPGHHFQIAFQVENKSVPRFRQIGAFGGISAFVEGWGLYAERLAAESGWYENDLEGRLGQLDSELFRARRLVVDTGIHAKGWTRQQAIDYGIEPSEVERYVVNPGQACSYMIGELKIIELREQAKKTLGDKFSLNQFHNTVLRTGTVPLEVLERQVQAFIANAR
jgi:uncharacterized protein (DUF885 family)